MSSPEELYDADVKSIILFGSHVRGDADLDSDRDVCIFTEAIRYTHLQDIRQHIASRFDVSAAEVTAYPTPIVESMCQVGSLFLWHLRFEGKILLDRDGFAACIFARLAPFEAHLRELSLLDAVQRDVQKAFQTHGCLTEFDLHLLHNIVRSISILLTHFGGRTTFGRNSSTDVARKLFHGFPLSIEQCEELSDWHLRYSRGTRIAHSLPSKERSLAILNSVNNLAKLAGRILS